ncbi:AP2/B3-like transcriptional factor family protein, putative [Medicago truncatula]|uniref:AP2/B3-like transcriptional factor family protein, putative n=1 Tax=Medicago truncatula TaxID=3880 RepID=G7IY80_MEDTR|nr:AP2/B3-like transcriptional factor family protein, putative [Medicago truncatula]
MVRRNPTLPIRFFKIILQTNLQRIQIPNNFTRRHGVGLSNPVLIKPPDGTKWKVGWKFFTENYSLGHGCLVMFKYKGTSKFDVLILDQNALEIDYSSCEPCDDKGNVGHSDNESLEI